MTLHLCACLHCDTIYIIYLFGFVCYGWECVKVHVWWCSANLVEIINFFGEDCASVSVVGFLFLGICTRLASTTVYVQVLF